MLSGENIDTQMLLQVILIMLFPLIIITKWHISRTFCENRTICYIKQSWSVFLAFFLRIWLICAKYIPGNSL